MRKRVSIHQPPVPPGSAPLQPAIRTVFFPRSSRRQKPERLRPFEMGCLVPAQVGVAVEGQFPDACIRREIDPFKPHPNEARACGILEKVDPVSFVMLSSAASGSARPNHTSKAIFCHSPRGQGLAVRYGAIFGSATPQGRLAVSPWPDATSGCGCIPSGPRHCYARSPWPNRGASPGGFGHDPAIH